MSKPTVTHTLWNSDRDVVVHAMYWGGELADLLTKEQWARVYLACDGFGGGMTVAIANDQCWDWSHVRDASEACFARLAPRVRRMLRGKVRIDVDGTIVNI